MLPARLLCLRLLLVCFVMAITCPVEARAACANPAGEKGEVVYNDDYSTMQFCNGTAWISMAASVAAEEADPQVGAMTASKWCAANAGASAIVCDKDAPLLSANNLSDLANAATARTSLGLGSIATQAASSVTITGGTINGTPLGGTTPAAGAFTTLSASGAATLSSTLGVTGNVAVNTNKFNVTATSGDTTVAGTLAVTGTASAATPTSSSHLATKSYVDTAVASAGGGIPSDFQVFTSSGTWTKPGTGTMAFIQCWGAGGGGGAGYQGPGSGGGGGGYVYVWKTLASLSSTVTVTIGSGGAGGNYSGANAGSSGGNTTFGAYLTANGGSGGNPGYASSQGYYVGGAGGSGSGTGAMVIAGARGASNTGSTDGVPSSGFTVGGAGGGGSGNTAQWSAANGVTAPGPGGGGGGGYMTSYNNYGTGSTGNNGTCIVTVY